MFDFSRFEVLTFDCYGTLINWEAGLLGALHPILTSHSKKIPDPELLALYGEFEQLAEQPPFQSYAEVLGSVVRQVGTALRFTPTADEVRSLAASLPNWKPWPDTVAALHQLKTRFRLTILSNIDNELFEFTRPKLEVAFDEVVTA